MHCTRKDNSPHIQRESGELYFRMNMVNGVLKKNRKWNIVQETLQILINLSSLSICIQSMCNCTTVISHPPFFMSESMTRLFKKFIQRCWSIQERNKALFVWASHWIVYSVNFFKDADSVKNETSNYFYERSLNNLTYLFKVANLFRNRTSYYYFYEWVI